MSSCYVCNHRVIIYCARCGDELTVSDERSTGMRNEATQFCVNPCECVNTPEEAEQHNHPS